MIFGGGNNATQDDTSDDDMTTGMEDQNTGIGSAGGEAEVTTDDTAAEDTNSDTASLDE